MPEKQQVSAARKKLISSACMLLIAAIMMVTSSFAWLVLSTAPEVRGIGSAIGANGALEMALNTGRKGGPLNGVVESGADVNAYWGNLVDLSDGYGLDLIKLSPAQLAEQDGKIPVSNGILKIPQYGADGRVTDLSASTVTGIYRKSGEGTTSEGFFRSAANDRGVRAIGVASDTTERQLVYRNALSAAAAAMSNAKNAAVGALNANGSKLASIVAARGLNEKEIYSQTEVAALSAMADDLEISLNEIKNAYIQYILAYAASAASDAPTYVAVSGAVKANGDLDAIAAAAGSTVPEGLTAAIHRYKETVNTLSDVKTLLDGLTGEPIAWGDLEEPLNQLADTDSLTLNGYTVEQIQKATKEENPSDTVTFGEVLDSVIGAAAGGSELSLIVSDGVYAEIAEQCGDYSAFVSISISYGFNVDAPATLQTASTKSNYLAAIGGRVKEAGEAQDEETFTPVRTFYGYILDLAFRTNAVNSALLLQTEGTDRIAGGNSASDETGGSGSTMTFAATEDFSSVQVQNLMKHIRIVFFDPDDGRIFASGELDTTNASLEKNNVTAPIQLTGDEADANVIVSLPQNYEKDVSVLVYLDGTSLSNADIAATGDIIGQLNLQFASSAKLIPMNYTSLKNGRTK